MNWLKLFDERQQKEIKFSQVYVNEFEHGTDGHNAKVIIAKMAQMLDKLEVEVQVPTKTSNEILSQVARILKVIE